MNPRAIDPAWLPGAGEEIVFAHGAVVNGWEMVTLRRRFARLGYRVRQFSYHSMLLGLDHNVAALAKFVAESDAPTVHVVGHSMGGVLTRLMFETQPDPRPGRLVAIGSPLLDCWVGRRFERWRWGPNLMGKTVHDHILRPRDTAWRGARDFGVIAGTFPFGVGGLFHDLPRPSDGVVLWGETRLEGLQGHVTYPLNHFGMLFSRRCTAQIACFLATGRFLEVPARRRSAEPRANPIPFRA